MEYNMSHENHNNLKPWKNKLEEFKKIPEPLFDKGASWEKLYEKLNEKHPAKKTDWYWMAAAFLVFALIISLFFINNKPDKTTASEIKTTSPNIANDANKTAGKKDEVEKASTIISSKNEIVANKKTNNKTIKTVPVKPFLKLRLTDTVSEQSLAIKPGGNFINPVNTSPDLVKAKPAKKKLKVVHVKELGDPAEGSTAIEGNVSTYYFQIRFANQEVYTSPAVSNEKGSAILKINTPVNL